MKKLNAKISAREWILTAIQHHSCIPNKATEHEIKRFIKRIQRDLVQLQTSKRILEEVNKKELERLIKEQSKDESDRNLRFDHAVRGE